MEKLKLDRHCVGGYRETGAPADLANVVDALWTHTTGSPDLEPVVHRVIPDLDVSLCFTCKRRADGWPENADLLLIGPVRTMRFYRPAPGHSMAAIRLKPEWVQDLLGVLPAEHADALDDFTLIDRAAGKRLLAAFEKTTSGVEALALLVDFVRRRLYEAHRNGSIALVHMGLEVIRHTPAAVRMDRLAGSLGISDRHFRRLVHETTGTSPQLYTRVRRFHGLLRSVDQTPRPRWAALAAAHGYADQSHLVREVHALSGVSPVTLHRERRQERRP